MSFISFQWNSELYKLEGRTQDEESAKKVDDMLLNYLNERNIEYKEVELGNVIETIVIPKPLNKS